MAAEAGCDAGSPLAQTGTARRAPAGPPAHSGVEPGGRAGTGRLTRGGLMPEPHHNVPGSGPWAHSTGPSRPSPYPDPAKAIDSCLEVPWRCGQGHGCWRTRLRPSSLERLSETRRDLSLTFVVVPLQYVRVGLPHAAQQTRTTS